MLVVHPTEFCYSGGADPSAPGGIGAVYQDLAADHRRTAQIAADVADALTRGRHCPDYHDHHTPVLAASLAKRAPGYPAIGFPDPRRLPLTPSCPQDSQDNP